VRIVAVLIAGWLTFATAINSTACKFARMPGGLIALAAFLHGKRG
jgi:hypothetical protein